MIRNILVSLVFIVALVIGGAYFYLDSLIKSGIEVAGSSALGPA